MQATGFKIDAGIDTFVRAIETSDFELSLPELDDKLRAQDGARVVGAGSTWAYNQ